MTKTDTRIRAVTAKRAKNGGSSDRREEAIAAAIDVLARCGARGLTHREVDRHLHWPQGSMSNYFRRRSEIFNAIAARIMQLDLADLSVFEADLAQQARMDVDLLARRILLLLKQWMSPVHRSRTLARAEILFEGTRNAEVRAATRVQMGIAEGLFQRIFDRLGSPDPVASARFFSVLISSLYVGVCVSDQVLDAYQLNTLVRTWASISIEQVGKSPRKRLVKTLGRSSKLTRTPPVD